MNVVNEEEMMQQRQVWVNDVQNLRAQVAALNDEITRIQRDCIAIDGAIQGCDTLLQKCHPITVSLGEA